MNGIYKVPYFNRWMKKAKLTDQVLLRAVDEMKKGLIDADLGNGLVKKRLAIGSRGKSGGARTIIATNKRDRWIFLVGFMKNERANITPKEEEALKEVSSDLLKLSQAEIECVVSRKVLVEVLNEKPDAN